MTDRGFIKKKKMIKETNCDKVDKKIRATIDKIIKEFKENPYAWNDERQVHYDFFKLLFEVFSSEEIKEYFIWEYRVGRPSYARGNKVAEVDLGMFCGNGNWIAVEFEFNLSPGKSLEEELIRCVEKLQSSPKCLDSMFRGYVVPLLRRDGQATAQGYGITYSELCTKNIQKAESSIRVSNIKLISDGIIL